MISMWKIRELTDKVTNAVMNYTEVESKVREATNDDTWGPTGQIMIEISHYTHSFQHYSEVMAIIWRRMFQENKNNWRRIYKALVLLAYLLRNGSERVVNSCREHLFDLKTLQNFSYIDESNKDQGINVRQKVKELIDFVQNDERLKEERKKAKANREKFVGLSNQSGSVSRHNNHSSFGTYSDYDQSSLEETSSQSQPVTYLDEKFKNSDNFGANSDVSKTDMDDTPAMAKPKIVATQNKNANKKPSSRVVLARTGVIDLGPKAQEFILKNDNSNMFVGDFTANSDPKKDERNYSKSSNQSQSDDLFNIADFKTEKNDVGDFLPSTKQKEFNQRGGHAQNLEFPKLCETKQINVKSSNVDMLADIISSPQQSLPNKHNTVNQNGIHLLNDEFSDFSSWGGIAKSASNQNSFNPFLPNVTATNSLSNTIIGKNMNFDLLTDSALPLSRTNIKLPHQTHSNNTFDLLTPSSYQNFENSPGNMTDRNSYKISNNDRSPKNGDFLDNNNTWSDLKGKVDINLDNLFLNNNKSFTGTPIKSLQQAPLNCLNNTSKNNIANPVSNNNYSANSILKPDKYRC
ncbi:unnamed protein product [Gordionus sp. m RMFG-2023]|uniref:clathrin interactor 1-like n=1 Tax=Gordionus sp. m RMFG-2023 TaxID=3053472 RepID=UPI0030E27B4F